MISASPWAGSVFSHIVHEIHASLLTPHPLAIQYNQDVVAAVSAVCIHSKENIIN